jgi:protein-S-isoprenylcysteine O-methyltransferase Ste14
LPRRTGTFVQRWRVPLGFLCGAIFLIAAQPTAVMLAIGGVLAIFGLLIRAWASGHIRKNDTLAISGPYAFTRNPLYLGSFLLGIGFTVAANNWWLVGLFAALFLGVYLPVMRIEARTLLELFGEEYEKYAKAVPLLLPRLTAYKPENESNAKFDLNLYLRYREYRAALGLVAAWCLLLLKSAFF